MGENNEDVSPNKWKLTATGLVLTVLWLGFLGIYLVQNRMHVQALSANEMGDFLAGAFAPLAFLWLVLGFFQQGQELRNSAKALWLQGRELQHSVEQQRELVSVTREQLQFDSKMLEIQRQELARSTQPILRLETGGSSSGPSGKRMYEFRLMNYGKGGSDVRVRADERILATAPTLAGGGHLKVYLELADRGEETLEVSVDYLDERLVPGSKLFQVVRQETRFKITDITPANSA